MKLDLIAFGAHPDDTELGCSGTLASLAKAGKSVGVIDLTRGEMGSRGTIQKREEEAARSSAIIGLAMRKNLGLPDTEILNTREFQLLIIRELRRYRPHIVILPPFEDRHPDHGMAARLLSDAVFYSGLVKIETRTEEGALQEPYRPPHVLTYMLDTPFEPDLVYDIRKRWRRKSRQCERSIRSSMWPIRGMNRRPTFRIPHFLRHLSRGRGDMATVLGLRSESRSDILRVRFRCKASIFLEIPGTLNSTRQATHSATHSATYSATHDPTFSPTNDPTHSPALPFALPHTIPRTAVRYLTSPSQETDHRSHAVSFTHAISRLHLIVKPVRTCTRIAPRSRIAPRT